jgi:hypothetical protein
MASKSFKLEFAVIGRYEAMYLEKYGGKVEINKYKEKWAVSSLIEDFGYDTVLQCLEYYFKTDKDGHPLSYFFFNFEQLKSIMSEKMRDDELRAERRRKTQELAREYLNGVQ